MAIQYKRVLLKLSGEALGTQDGSGINYEAIAHIVDEVASICALGVEVAIVVGGGNFFRGETSSNQGGFDRVTADYVGMLATVMNAMILQESFRRGNMSARAMSALQIESVVEPYIRGKAIRYLEEGTIVIFAAGTGNPFFTTDTAAALRAAEIGADIVLKATKVDGVYSDDPHICPTATRFERLSFDEAINKKLRIMDATAFSLCRDRNMPVVVFRIFQSKVLEKIILGKSEGTLVN